MGGIWVSDLGKAYKHYPSRWARLMEWVMPGHRPRHQLHWVLQGINFKVEPGEAVGIVGMNGAGKSTLLKILTGTTAPTRGHVEIQGRVAALLELGMGFHPDFTGRQNVDMACQLLGYEIDLFDEIFAQIEEFAEIDRQYLDQPIRTYSSGMQMRLAFSVATAKRPDILIVDEALSVGDAYFQAKCFQRIRSFKDQGTTLLLVSHNPQDLVKHCERAILLRKGSLAMDASSRAVTNIYLEEMIGKPKQRTSTPTTSTSTTALNELFDGTADVFYTRTGYNKNEHRWGNGEATILDYVLAVNGDRYPAQVLANHRIDLYLQVQFHEAQQWLVPGLIIKTLEGVFIYGTNSDMCTGDGKRITCTLGETKIFRFSLPLILNQGHYLVSLGVSSRRPGGELTPLDRRYDSIIINVARDNQMLGIVDMQASFECIDNKATATEG